MIQREDSAGHVKILTHVPDEDLPGLYKLCTAFAFLSLEEGFGIPVIESMFAGAPVTIASSNSAVKEAGGGGALLVDPLNYVLIRDALQAAVDGEKFSAKSKITSHLKQFDTEVITAQWMHLYKSLI